MDQRTARQYCEGAVTFATTWLESLAKGDFKAATAMLYHTRTYSWKPEKLQALIGSYGATDRPDPGNTMKITPLSQMRGRKMPSAAGRDKEVEVIVEDHEYCFHHPSLPIDAQIFTVGSGSVATCTGTLDIPWLPLDGEWSDLSAVFFIHEIDGTIKYELERIEVM